MAAAVAPAHGLSMSTTLQTRREDARGAWGGSDVPIAGWLMPETEAIRVWSRVAVAAGLMLHQELGAALAISSAQIPQ